MLVHQRNKVNAADRVFRKYTADRFSPKYAAGRIFPKYPKWNYRSHARWRKTGNGGGDETDYYNVRFKRSVAKLRTLKTAF